MVQRGCRYIVNHDTQSEARMAGETVADPDRSTDHRSQRALFNMNSNPKNLEGGLCGSAAGG
jgi:hypothetical protein